MEQIRAFHRRLCELRVLDPACGSGNFLYVTLEHMKRLEGEILNTLGDLGETGLLELAGVTVDPHQFLGLELNPRAAAIAEMVLWIGYLQWHFRTHGRVTPPEPVLRDFHNIECRDAVLAYDDCLYATDQTGRPLTRWDGKTYKSHPATGEDVPDESARVPLERYINPRQAEWPAADFVVGNPPFIGASGMRRALGDGYVDALRETWNEVPESADFVMYWWHHAANLARSQKLRRFGLITTNSLRQTFNRRVVQKHLEAKKPLTLAFAIPDHPWVDSADGAAVRIAMTVGTGSDAEGTVATVIAERRVAQDGHEVDLRRRSGRVHSDLTVGAAVAATKALRANEGISSPGVKLHGAGFIVTPEQATALGLGRVDGLERHIRDYRNGRDLTQSPRGVKVIDLYGLQAEEVRDRFPAVYQWVSERVKPERDAKSQTKDGAGYARFWWLFGKPRQELRGALCGLNRYVATVETSKHRFFTFLDDSVLPDNMLINIAVDDAHVLGVLSSRLHVSWALAAGGTLEDRPRYNKSRCFETFPFPDATDAQKEHIRSLAEQLDAHRKARQAEHPYLTLTGLYNVLEKLRRDEALTAKERAVHEQGLVSVPRELHDELDRAVFAAYGWDDLADRLVGRPGATTPWPEKPAEQAEAEEALLTRLVELNTRRAAEEARGRVRWLRPDYQAPEAAPAQVAMDAIEAPAAAAGAAAGKLAWPKQLTEQVQAVREQLAAAPVQTVESLAGGYKRRPVKGVRSVLEALEILGVVRRDDEVYRLSG